MLDFPVTEDKLRQLDGETLVFCNNAHGSSQFNVRSEVKIMSNGAFRGGRIDCGDGMLNVYDSNGLWAYFDAVEYNGASVYLRGSYVREYAGSDNRFATMHIKRKLGSRPFGICISTCQEYAEYTVPKLLKSLAAAKIPAERIAVVVGGYGEDSDSVVDGIRTVTRTVDGMGFNGLWAAGSEYDYYLLLHDTTSVEKDFCEKIADIDIGLSPDVVKGETGSEIGLYSADFIGRIYGNFNDTPGVAVENGAHTVMTACGETTVKSPRDVYGRGEGRNTRVLPIGVLKFESDTLNRIRR